MDVSEVVQAILRSPGYSPVSLASELGTSTTTVQRWAGGTARPRPLAEGKLRRIQAQTRSGEIEVGSLFSWGEDVEAALEVRAAIDGVLRETREILHRRGRLSSRNEALDELSKLLFAHLMSEASGGRGLSLETLAGYSADHPARSLRAFVEDAVAKHLPVSLTHEMSVRDFQLRLRPEENLLAKEVVACFERLGSTEATKAVAGPGGLDVLNDVFGKFLATSFADEKELGQYLTPTEVVQFMVRVALSGLSSAELDALRDPLHCSEFGVILDPSCGVGSFLTEILRAIHLSLDEDSMGEDAVQAWLAKMCTEVLVGIDKSERMVRLALTNMAIFGFPAARLHLANSLAVAGRDKALSQGLRGEVGLILTNPPFGAEFDSREMADFELVRSWASKAPTTVPSELLFMERYIDWLRPGGHLVAIVPDSILTNRGIFEDLRRALASQVTIRSVVSLPAVTFGSAGTNTKTSVLHLVKKAPRGKAADKTRFAICADIGYSIATRGSQRVKVRHGGGELPKILGEMLEGSDDGDSVRVVENVNQWSRWDATYHASLPPVIQAAIDRGSAEYVRVSTVADLSADRIDPRRLGRETFDYIEISDVDTETSNVSSKTLNCSEAPSRARKLVKAGDVLVSTVRPERRVVGVVREDQDGFVCTTGFAVLRPRIEPLLLARLLRTDFVVSQLLRNNIGIAYPAIEEACLPEIILPVAAEQLRGLENEARALLNLEAKLTKTRRALEASMGEEVRRWELGLATASPRLRQGSRTNSRRQSSRGDSD